MEFLLLIQKQMKAFNLLLIMVLALLFMSSCKEDNPENLEIPDTIVEEKEEDTIKEDDELGYGAPQFPKIVNFNLDGGSLTIHSEKNPTNWYFSEIELNDSVIFLRSLPTMKDLFPDWSFLQSMDVKYENHPTNVVYVKSDRFSLKKIDNKTIDIIVEPSKEAWQFTFLADGLNCGEYITIIQKDERN